MKNVVLTAAILIALAPRARAQGMPQTLGNDPLTRQILMKTAQPNGGVTAVVRVRSGQPVELKMPGASAAFSAVLAPAAASPAEGLRPAPGLASKTARVKGRKLPRRAVDQLKRVDARKSWTAR